MKRPVHYDIRTEVWAARQKAKGVDLVIRAQGTFKRPYSFDILHVTTLDSDQEVGNRQETSVAYVDLSREGLYDMLPESLSHPARRVKEGDRAMVDESRRLKQEERDNRTFWLPFEQETFRQRIQIEEQENQTLTQTTGPVWTELYAYLLGAAGEGLTDSQRACLLSIWTNAHQTVGDWERTAYYFSRFLDVSVRIWHGPLAAITNRNEFTNANHWQPARLGEGRLGLDYVLPQSTTTTDDGGLIRMAFGPLNAAQMQDFLPGGASLRHINMLAGYLLPADADWQIDVLPDPFNDGFVLSDLGSSGRLGLTTILN